MKEKETPIALALSGGGFRATLFHLGVIRLLLDLGKLSSVRYIGAVSGGSVMAAHLALRWPDYTNKTSKDNITGFDAAAAELIEFVRSDVRGRIIRRSIFAWLTIALRFLLPTHKRWTMGNLLEKEYSRLFRGATIRQLRGGGRPEIFINSTSLTTGTTCNFSSRDFRWQERGGKEKSVLTDNTAVAFAVAASSAFPPLFQPIEISHKKLNCSQNEFGNAQRLTDGGVYDNLGINNLLANSPTAELLIVSDAEGDFDTELEKTYWSLVSRNIRASNLLMTRVSSLQLDALRGSNTEFVSISIKHQIQDEGDDIEKIMDINDQRLVAKLRTDLDAFSDDEIGALISHGYFTARRALFNAGLIFVGPPRLDWSLFQKFEKQNQKRSATLERGSGRQWRVVSRKDWVSFATVAVLLLFGFGIYEAGAWAYKENIQNSRAAGASEVAADANMRISTLTAEIGRLQALAKQRSPQVSTTTFQICRGEHSAQCPAGSVPIGCGDITAYAAGQCSSHTQTVVSSRGGNRCGYTVAQIFCTRTAP